MIPKVLRKERDIIYKYINGDKHMMTEYYGADPEQEATKEYYLSNGVVKQSEYHITAPIKFTGEADKIKDAFDISPYQYCNVKFV